MFLLPNYRYFVQEQILHLLILYQNHLKSFYLSLYRYFPFHIILELSAFLYQKIKMTNYFFSVRLLIHLLNYKGLRILNMNIVPMFLYQGYRLLFFLFLWKKFLRLFLYKNSNTLMPTVLLYVVVKDLYNKMLS